MKDNPKIKIHGFYQKMSLIGGESMVYIVYIEDK